MAGSYNHCRNEDGSFSFDLIENMGDAWEACEMMFFMIGWLAHGDQGQIKAAEQAYYNSVYPHNRDTHDPA